jgi:hypothetical protein
MSRFKLFGLMTAMLAAVMSDRKITDEERNKQAKSLNRQAGGMLFTTGGVYSGKKLNQRQIRKRRRQNPNSRKWNPKLKIK